MQLFLASSSTGLSVGSVVLVSVLVERESSCIVTGSDQAKEEEEEGRGCSM